MAEWQFGGLYYSSDDSILEVWVREKKDGSEKLHKVRILTDVHGADVAARAMAIAGLIADEPPRLGLYENKRGFAWDGFIDVAISRKDE